MNASADQLPPRSRATLLWGLVGAGVCAWMIPLEPNLLEEGFILNAVERMLEGDRLYQDVVAFTGPLPYELLALLFRIFGHEILVGRVAVVVLHGIAAACVYALAIRARAGALAHAAAAVLASTPVLLFPLFSLFYYSTLAFSLSLIAAYAALRGLESQRWAFAAGVLLACVALCKQTVGLLLAGGLVVSIAACARPRGGLRPILALAMGGCVVAVATLARFAASGGLAALVQSLVVLPLSFETSFDSPLVNFWPPGEFDEVIRESQDYYVPHVGTLIFGRVDPGPGLVFVTQLLYALPFLAGAATLLRRALGPLPAGVWIHFAAFLALGTNLFPRTDWGHLIFVLPSSLVQLLLLVPTAPGVIRSTRPRALVAAGMGLVLGLTSVGAGTMLYAVSGPPSFGPRVPLRPVSKGYRIEAVPRAIRYLREHAEPGEEIFVPRAEPLVYFATETRNPTPYGGVIPGPREEQQRVILEALRDLRYVVMSDVDQPVYTYYRDEFPEVQRYLERHFHVPGDFLGPGSNWLLVLERGEDRGATVLDLVDARGQGRPWVRLPSRRRVPASPVEAPIAVAQNRRYLPIRLGAKGGGIDFEIEVPARAVFQADVGYPVAIRAWRSHLHPEHCRMVVSIARDGEFEELAVQSVLDAPKPASRWTPIEVDLSRYAGERVTLRLELIPDVPLDSRKLAWWGSPRIAQRPGAEE
jgi:hypothetical protein